MSFYKDLHHLQKLFSDLDKRFRFKIGLTTSNTYEFNEARVRIKLLDAEYKKMFRKHNRLEVQENFIKVLNNSGLDTKTRNDIINKTIGTSQKSKTISKKNVEPTLQQKTKFIYELVHNKEFSSEDIISYANELLGIHWLYNPDVMKGKSKAYMTVVFYECLNSDMHLLKDFYDPTQKPLLRKSGTTVCIVSDRYSNWGGYESDEFYLDEMIEVKQLDVDIIKMCVDMELYFNIKYEDSNKMLFGDGGKVHTKNLENILDLFMATKYKNSGVKTNIFSGFADQMIDLHECFDKSKFDRIAMKLYTVSKQGAITVKAALPDRCKLLAGFKRL